MILADTSVWVDHLRAGDAGLRGSLEVGNVYIHTFIIGELACGQMKNRGAVIGLLRQLPTVPRATDDEALQFIETHSLMAKGIGYVDVHLLTSLALSTGVRLWTRDRRLASVAADLGLAA
jgi:predicted nucleic acid-binding protein